MSEDPYASARRGRITITLSPQAIDAIDFLAETGLHGRGRVGVARELLLRALRKELGIELDLDERLQSYRDCTPRRRA